MMVVPQMDDEGLQTTLERVNNDIGERGGTVVRQEQWGGMRRLAYPINDHNEGNYVLTYLELDPERASELEANLRVSENVLRHLLLRINAIPEAKAAPVQEPVAEEATEAPVAEPEAAASEEGAATEESAAQEAQEEAPEAAAPEAAPVAEAESEASVAEAEAAPEAEAETETEAVATDEAPEAEAAEEPEKQEE